MNEERDVAQWLGSGAVQFSLLGVRVQTLFGAAIVFVLVMVVTEFKLA